MFSNRYWQSTTSVLLLTGMLGSMSAPLILAQPAQAQVLKIAQQSVVIPSGTIIPVRYDKAQKIVVSPKETAPVTLLTASNVKTSNGTILIPTGTQVVGQLQPAEGGSQFVAKELIFSDGTRKLINANSGIITKTQEVRSGGDTGSILQGALIGAGAATAISAITGNKKITVGKVLIGGGLGALGGLLFGKKKVDVIVINPNTDLDITLRSDLLLSQL